MADTFLVQFQTVHELGQLRREEGTRSWISGDPEPKAQLHPAEATGTRLCLFIDGLNPNSGFRYNDQFWSLKRAAKDLTGAEHSSVVQRHPFVALAPAPNAG
jgi:hypothetical protein